MSGKKMNFTSNRKLENRIERTESVAENIEPEWLERTGNGGVSEIFGLDEVDHIDGNSHVIWVTSPAYEST